MRCPGEVESTPYDCTPIARGKVHAPMQAKLDYQLALSE